MFTTGRLNLTNELNRREMLEIYTGETRLESLPDDILLMILELAGMISIGARSYRFDLFFCHFYLKKRCLDTKKRNVKNLDRGGSLM
jgi:hypothetical protein